MFGPAPGSIPPKQSRRLLKHPTLVNVVVCGSSSGDCERILRGFLHLPLSERHTRPNAAIRDKRKGLVGNWKCWRNSPKTGLFSWVRARVTVVYSKQQQIDLLIVDRLTPNPNPNKTYHRFIIRIIGCGLYKDKLLNSLLINAIYYLNLFLARE